MGTSDPGGWLAGDECGEEAHRFVCELGVAHERGELHAEVDERDHQRTMGAVVMSSCRRR